MSLIYKDLRVWCGIYLCQQISFFNQAMTDVLGPDIHTKTVGKIHLVQFDSEGLFGWIPTKRKLINQFLSGELFSFLSKWVDNHLIA